MPTVMAASERTSWLVIGWVGACAVLVANAWQSLETVVDDAYISARYASHAASGSGLVYNAGEPAIEGYTNLLWTLWLTMAKVVGIHVHTAMVGGGLFFGCVALGFVTLLGAHLAGRPHPAVLAAPFALALDPHFAVVSTNGLETAQFIAAVTGACWVALVTPDRFRVVAGFFLGAAAAVRPEGVVVGALLVGADLWRRRTAWRDASTWRLAWPMIATWLVLQGFRLWTYGAMAPNTHAAKGARPLDALFKSHYAYVKPDLEFWVVLGILLLAAPWFGPRRPARLTVAMVALATLAISLTVNLWMPGGRLFMPAVALTVAMWAGTAAAVGPWARGGIATVLVGGALVALTGSIGTHVRRYDSVHSVLRKNGTERAAKHLRRNLPAGSWLATRDAGTLAHYVGPDVAVAELHDRALTQLHPDGAPAQVREYTPINPEVIALTVARVDKKAPKYANDRLIFRRTTEPYVYLGRVEQHYHRFYDYYVRADLELPPFPANIVVNRAGWKPPARREAPQSR